MIPKIIHYCWFGPKPFPGLVKKCMETWKVHLPEYELMLWNESNSPMEIAFVKDAYAAGKYAFVSDYIRFWALYKYGGIYLDTDMYIVKPFNDLLKEDAFFGWETANMISIGCCAIGSHPCNTFIGDIINTYKSLKFYTEHIEQIVVPQIVTPIYLKHKYYNCRLLSYDFFYPFPYEIKENVRNFKQYITPNTIAVHLWNYSWESKRDKVKRIISVIIGKKLSKLIIHFKQRYFH